MITRAEQPDKGTFTVGPNVKLGYIDQSRDSLDDSKTVWEEISEGVDVLDLGGRDCEKPCLCIQL